MDDGFFCGAAVGAVFFAIVGMVIGNGRGRAGEGLVLGGLLGPIGVIITLALRPSQHVAEREMRARLVMEAKLRGELGLPGGSAEPDAELELDPVPDGSGPTTSKPGVQWTTLAILTILLGVLGWLVSRELGVYIGELRP